MVNLIKYKPPGISTSMPIQQQQGSPVSQGLKGQWKQSVGAAKIAWGKLTDDELLQTEGEIQKLAGLIQERYAIASDEANRQVKEFLNKCDK